MYSYIHLTLFTLVLYLTCVDAFYEVLGEGKETYKLVCSGKTHMIKSKLINEDSKCGFLISYLTYKIDGFLVNPVGYPYKLKNFIKETFDECKLGDNKGMLRPTLKLEGKKNVVELVYLSDYDIYLSNGTLVRLEMLVRDVKPSTFLMSMTSLGYPNTIKYIETSSLYISHDKLHNKIEEISNDGYCYLYRSTTRSLYVNQLLDELNIRKISRVRRSEEHTCSGYKRYFGRFACPQLNCTITKEGCFDPNMIGRLVRSDSCWIIKGVRYSSCLYRDLSDCRLPEDYHSTSLCPNIHRYVSESDDWDDKEDNMGEALATCSKLIMTSLVTCITKLAKHQSTREHIMIKQNHETLSQIQLIIGRNKLTQAAAKGLTESQIIQGRALNILDMNFNTTTDALTSLMRYATKLSSLTSSGFKNVSTSTDDIIRIINRNNRELQKFIDFISRFHNREPLIKLQTLYNTMNINIQGTQLSKPKLVSIEDLMRKDTMNHNDILGILNKTKVIDNKLTHINHKSIVFSNKLLLENSKTRESLKSNIEVAQLHTDQVAKETLGAVWKQRIKDLGIMIPISVVGALLSITYLCFKRNRNNTKKKD